MSDVPRQYLKAHHAEHIQSLARLVQIASISNDGQHQAEIDLSADLVASLMESAGLQNIQTLRSEGSNPYVFGEWLGAPGAPTVLLYAHHDVQPINFAEQWLSPPLELTSRAGRLFGRGSCDDKGGVVAQLASIAAFLKSDGTLPVNVKVIIEGEEEVGSPNLLSFFKANRDLLRSDLMVVTDTENVKTGTPSITYSLRGVLSMLVEVESATAPSHSGFVGGGLADAAIALNVILSRLFWGDGPIPIPGYNDRVRPLTDAERATIRGVGWDEEGVRRDFGVLPGVQLGVPKGVDWYEATWRRPAISVIAQEASSIGAASNQVLPRASAVVSCRIVPDQDPGEAFDQVRDYLTANPPWGTKVRVTQRDKPASWWITDPTGPAFTAALDALRQGYQKEPVPIGAGGTIGFVGPVAELLGNVPALLLGIEDAQSNPHAPNESLHEGDWFKLMTSITYLYENLAALPEGSFKAKA
jgi:acetylornithine deacetylase/succinyl-diaminopimelate desuccinylase-like protein